MASSSISTGHANVPLPSTDEKTPPEKVGLSDQTNYVPQRKIITIFLACATVSITGLLDETMIAVYVYVLFAYLSLHY